EIRFVIDQTFDQMDETRRLLNQDTVRRDVAAHDEDEDDQA
ncbi:ribosome-binding factor A, partial [Escherichia coli]|nr:ribosome-binding factor A [Escherichia coli]